MIFKYLALLWYSPYIYYLNYSKKNLDEIYDSLSGKTGGTFAFSAMVEFFSPYSGSIDSVIEEFDKDVIKCSIVEKRYLQNPFKSIHAIALANLGELTSGLLMMNYLQSSHKKGIVTHIKIEYYKKARGKITAICDINSLHDNVINTKMYNEENVLVGEMYCTWDIKNKEV